MRGATPQNQHVLSERKKVFVPNRWTRGGILGPLQVSGDTTSIRWRVFNISWCLFLGGHDASITPIVVCPSQCAQRDVPQHSEPIATKMASASLQWSLTDTEEVGETQPGHLDLPPAQHHLFPAHRATGHLDLPPAQHHL